MISRSIYTQSVKLLAFATIASSWVIGCGRITVDAPEETTPVEESNLAPVVRAGSDQTIEPSTINLDGSVADDGKPGTVTTLWEQMSGPQDADLEDAEEINTEAEFVIPGVYVLRLTATDGELSSSDEVVISVDIDGKAEVDTYDIFETTINHSGNYQNPYTQVEATATIQSPDREIMRIPLFWNGGNRWTFRYSPGKEGTWNWSVKSNDPGLDQAEGDFRVLPSDQKGGVRVRSEYPHHFEYEDGTPYWLMGDTLWNAFNIDTSENLTRESVEQYIDVRADQGFNYIHSNLITIPRNEGGAAFEDFEAEIINPAFWQEVDTRLEYINQNGITAMLMLAWAEDDRVGDWAGFANDEARLRYARYIVGRYSAYNVAFNVAGEWNEYGSKQMYQNIAAEIVKHDPHNRLIAIHPGELSYTVEEFAKEDWMSFADYQQNYRRLHQRIIDARDHDKPVVNSEYAYYLRDSNSDGKVDKPNSETLEDIRHATWDIAMAGGYFVTGWGNTYFGGTRDPGTFDVDAPQNDDWEAEVQHVAKLFNDLEWWKLEPIDELLQGRGEYYLLAEPSQQYIAYIRNTIRPLSLDLGEAGEFTYQVRLYNPRSGGYRELSDVPQQENTMTLTPPDRQDWVFVITR
ncbi:MAG: DUF4038 domain-containing protein [Microcoleaceae cyanobacterium]